MDGYWAGSAEERERITKISGQIRALAKVSNETVRFDSRTMTFFERTAV
jgi:hypothetical protein